MSLAMAYGGGTCDDMPYDIVIKRNAIVLHKAGSGSPAGKADLFDW